LLLFFVTNSESKKIHLIIKYASINFKKLGERKYDLWIMRFNSKKRANLTKAWIKWKCCLVKNLLTLPLYKCCMVIVQILFLNVRFIPIKIETFIYSCKPLCSMFHELLAALYKNRFLHESWKKTTFKSLWLRRFGLFVWYNGIDKQLLC